MLKVGAIMKRDVATVSPSDTVAEAVRLMSERRLGAVLVVEEGRLRGIFSERDLLKRVIARSFPVQDTQIRSVMTPNPVTVFETTSVRDATQLVREHGFRLLPVIDSKGEVVGTLPARDFLQVVVQGLERFIEDACSGQTVEERTDPYDVMFRDPPEG